MYYLYDPRYNLKTETTLESVSKVFRLKESELLEKKDKGEKISRYYYLVDDNTPLKDIKKIYARYKIEAEAWKPIEGAEDCLISNYGRFKKGNKFLLPFIVKRHKDESRNKQFIRLTINGVTKNYSVARLVAYHFVDKYYYEIGGEKKADKYKRLKYNDLVVYHKNGVVHDNYHGNLEWLDREDLGKVVGKKRYHGQPIIARCAMTGEILGHYSSTRHASKELPLSRTSVQNALNTGEVVCDIYKFEYEEIV